MSNHNRVSRMKAVEIGIRKGWDLETILKGMSCWLPLSCSVEES